MIEIDNTSAKRIARYLAESDIFMDRLSTAIAAKCGGITVTPLREAAVTSGAETATMPKAKPRTTRAQEV